MGRWSDSGYHIVHTDHTDSRLLQRRTQIDFEIFTHDDPVELVSRHTKIGWKQAEMI